MAYIVYFACDYCGKEGGAWMNRTVSQGIVTKIARDRGWQVGKRGYVCPKCQRKRKDGGQAPQREE